MKKNSKLIISILVVLLLVVGVQKGLKYFLQGPARPFNALVISGDKENVDKAKEVYKDNTKYTKDYEYKPVVNIEKQLDENGNVIIDKPVDKNGKEIEDAEGVERVIENRFIVITKETAKEMLKDNIIRVKTDQEPTSGSLETEILKDLKNIDSNKNLFLGNHQSDKVMDVNGKKIELQQENQSWIGYYPDADGYIVITDDTTYKSIQESEKTISLIKFNKGSKDLRNAQDKAEPIEKLSGIQNIDVDYAKVNK